MTRRGVFFTAATLAALVLASAGRGSAAPLAVVATTSDLAWFAREVGGDRVKVAAIAHGYQDPHYVEPKPSYIVSLSKARLLLHVGLELEVGWLPKLLDGAHNPQIQEGSPGLWSPAGLVRVIEKPTGAVDRASGDIHPFGNPHYWLDPDNARAIARGLAERLAELDPEGATGYRSRAQALVARIEQKIADWDRRLAPFRGTPLVTYHKSFSYFLEHFGLRVVDYIEPRPGVPPSASHLAGLVRRARDEQVRLLLIESFFDPRDARFVGEKIGATVVTAPVSVEAVDDARSWFDVIEILVTAVEKHGKS